jgi:hypothetical protein
VFHQQAEKGVTGKRHEMCTKYSATHGEAYLCFRASRSSGEDKADLKKQPANR